MKAPTAATSRFVFYDVESLDNVFTVAFYEPRNDQLGTKPSLEIYILTENKEADPLHTWLTTTFDPNKARLDIVRTNPAFDGTMDSIEFIHVNASRANAQRLMGKFGVSTANPEDIHNPAMTPTHEGLAPLCDTHPEYSSEKHHPFYAGYNSVNYDLTILAILYAQLAKSFETDYLASVSSSATTEVEYRERLEREYLDHIPQPHSIREYNDEMFSKFITYMPNMLTSPTSSIGKNKKWNSDEARIRRNFLSSGRHIDVSKFNEVQQKVGLKRQLGILGHQIKESEKLKGDTTIASPEEFYELLAYNASDVIGLKHLFDDPIYSGGFDLKAALLYQYPETVYAKDFTSTPARPKISPANVRSDRLVIDDTSAKFVGRVLAPYTQLTDIDTVSFMYPHPEIAKELGIESVDVLDSAKEFFFSHVTGTDEKSQAAREQFMRAYEFYSSIRGKNFNSSEAHTERTHAEHTYAFSAADAHSTPRSGNVEVTHLPMSPVNIPYYREDGTPTTGYVTFSTGGIHGAEFNQALCDYDNLDIDDNNSALASAQEKHPEPLDLWGEITVSPRGEKFTHTRLFKAGSTKTKLTRLRDLRVLGKSRTEEEDKEFADLSATVGYRDPQPRKEVFGLNSRGTEELNSRYAMTSMAPSCFHEDFTSYYPNLLRNMRAFYNPELGDDRYARIFFQKEEYNTLRKDPSLSADERHMYDILRDGTKLILNSATGVGATPYNNPVRMNNRILSMRLIGQILTWRIGQAQAFAGADIVSTNTDGLYSAGLTAEHNNAVLKREAARIHVDIEPEEIRLVSKDANNRAEIALDGTILSTGGGSLAAYKHPLLTKTSTAPSIVDRVLGEYLAALLDKPMNSQGTERLTIESDFDRELASRIYTRELNSMTLFESLRSLQHIVSSSHGSLRYLFSIEAYDTTDPSVTWNILDENLENYNPTPVQHYNRIFFLKPGTEDTVFLRNAVARKTTPATRAKRKRDNLPETECRDVAREILSAHGAEKSDNALSRIPEDRDLVVTKVTKIEADTPVGIHNGDLTTLSDHDLNLLRGNINHEVYLDLIEKAYANWQNAVVPTTDDCSLTHTVKA